MTTPEQILVVGIDDVCAAPLVGAVLRSQLQDLDQEVGVATAGSEAVTGEPTCSVAVKRLLPDAALGTHRSTPVHAEQIRRADLVIVLDREQRALVNRLVPGRQRIVFTLREAASLALLDGTDVWAGADSVAAFAEELHRRRGLVKPDRLSVPRRGLLRRPVAVLDVDDLPDAHGLDAGAHAWTLAQARTGALALAGALRGRLESSRAAA